MFGTAESWYGSAPAEIWNSFSAAGAPVKFFSDGVYWKPRIFFKLLGSFGYKTEEISVKSEKRSATTKTSELL